MSDITKQDGHLIARDIAKMLSQKGVSCAQAMFILEDAKMEVQKIPLAEVKVVPITEW